MMTVRSPIEKHFAASIVATLGVIGRDHFDRRMRESAAPDPGDEAPVRTGSLHLAGRSGERLRFLPLIAIPHSIDMHQLTRPGIYFPSRLILDGHELLPRLQLLEAGDDFQRVVP